MVNHRSTKTTIGKTFYSSSLLFLAMLVVMVIIGKPLQKPITITNMQFPA